MTSKNTPRITELDDDFKPGIDPKTGEFSEDMYERWETINSAKIRSEYKKKVATRSGTRNE